MSLRPRQNRLKPIGRVLMTHGGAWLRGALYIGIAVGNEALPSLLSGQPINPPAFALKLLLAAAITLRAFIDESPAQANAGTIALSGPSLDAPQDAPDLDVEPEVQSA